MTFNYEAGDFVKRTGDKIYGDITFISGTLNAPNIITENLEVINHKCKIGASAEFEVMRDANNFGVCFTGAQPLYTSPTNIYSVFRGGVRFCDYTEVIGNFHVQGDITNLSDISTTGNITANKVIASNPKVLVYRSTAQTIPNNTWTNITWDAEVFDVGGMFTSPSISLDVKEDGYYLVIGKIGFVAGTANTGRGLRIYKNATNLTTIILHTANSTDAHTTLGSILTYAEEGDYFRMMAWQNSGGDLNTGFGQTSSYFGAVLLV